MKRKSRIEWWAKRREKISPENEGKKEEEENNDSCSFLSCILTPHTQLLAPLRAHIIFFHQPFHPRHVEHMKCKMAEHKKMWAHIYCVTFWARNYNDARTMMLRSCSSGKNECCTAMSTLAFCTRCFNINVLKIITFQLFRAVVIALLMWSVSVSFFECRLSSFLHAITKIAVEKKTSRVRGIWVEYNGSWAHEKIDTNDVWRVLLLHLGATFSHFMRRSIKISCFNTNIIISKTTNLNLTLTLF